MVSPRDHELCSWGGGVPTFPLDHEQSRCHHELPHGLMVKYKKMMLNMDQAMMQSVYWLVFVNRQLCAFFFLLYNSQQMAAHAITYTSLLIYLDHLNTT